MLASSWSLSARLGSPHIFPCVISPESLGTDALTLVLLLKRQKEGDLSKASWLTFLRSSFCPQGLLSSRICLPLAPITLILRLIKLLGRLNPVSVAFVLRGKED